MKTTSVHAICGLLSTFIMQAIVMPADATPIKAAPLAPAPCLCGGKLTPLLANMCVCKCSIVTDAFNAYMKECPESKFYEFNKNIAVKCIGVENTEDCEFFKKSDGKLTDAYKNCRDKLDSIQDDCENCSGGCTIPGQEDD